MPSRIKELRNRADMTQQELADRIDADSSTIFRYEQDADRMFNKNAHAIARVLGLRGANELVSGSPDQVEIVGNVGAGAQVFPLDNDNEWIDGPPGLTEGLAVRVVGRSMMPVYRPDDILYAEKRSQVLGDVINVDCIVQVTDGPRLVKRVLKGTAPGFFRLYSYDTHDETDDLILDWASPIRWISR